MARRASSGINSTALLIGGLLLVLVVGGGYWFINREPSGFDAPELEFTQALNNGPSLAGNKYQVRGTLTSREVKANSSLVSLQIGGESSSDFLPVKIPEGFKGGNLNLQSDYLFLIEFDPTGVPIALDVKPL